MDKKKTGELIRQARTGKKYTQTELGDLIGVTNKAVSRWETGETIPNTETLKLLSGIFDVSINTLLGTPRRLVCQCCGMPLEDGVIGREPDGSFNEDYCKWCYADGVFAYQSKEQLLDFLLAHMPNPENTPAAERRTQYDAYLSQLKHWK